MKRTGPVPFAKLAASVLLVLVAACGPQAAAPSGALVPGASARSQAAWILADVRPPAVTADAFRALTAGHGLVAGDRTAWTRTDDGGWVPADPVTNETRNGITGWGDGLVAWADGSVITTSRDGVRWADASHGPAEGTPSRVVAIGDRLLLLGDATKERLGAWVSDDGDAWTALTDAPQGLAGAAPLMTGGLVAVGTRDTTGTVWVKGGGGSWSSLAAPRGTDGEPLSLHDVAVGGPAIVTVGYAGERPAGWVSSDTPAAWRQSLDLREPDSWLSDVEHGDLGFVIAGRSAGRPALWLSTDGEAWTFVGLPLPPGDEGTGTASRVVTTDEGIVVFGYATADAGNGGDSATAYLVWTLEPGGR
ncbi:MAG TPA: hypothetical protein VES19_12220 [Candidatus Limnocylindrales bacterium]|nr:hypothetical protein [Candidatus Limnocylindrales bacterium]